MPKSSTKGRGTSRGRGDERDFAMVCAARGSGVARRVQSPQQRLCLLLHTIRILTAGFQCLKNSRSICFYKSKRKPMTLNDFDMTWGSTFSL